MYSVKTYFFQTSPPLHWHKVFFASKQFDLISRLIWYFHGILIHMFMKFQNSFKLPKTQYFLLQIPTYFLNKWDYDLAWHEQEARRNKLLRITEFGVSSTFIDSLLLFHFVYSLKKLLFTHLQVRARNIMMVDAQTDYLVDQWTNCKTATWNLSGDWLTCYDLFFTPHENFKPLRY